MAESEALSAEELLEREKTERPRGAFAGIAAAVIGVAASMGIQLVYHGYPHVTIIDDLRVGIGEPIGRDGLRSEQLRFVADRTLPFLATAVGQAISAVLFAFLLYTLYRATVARSVRIPSVARTLVVIGGATGAIGTLTLQIAIQANAHSAVDSQDWLAITSTGSGATFGFLLLLVSGLTLAGATVMISLAAQRAGLLTKFLGILGLVAGALMVLANPAITGGGGIGLLFQAIWALLVGMMLLGRSLSGPLPAWQEGIAVPWPSRQNAREAAERGKPDRKRAPAPVQPDSAPTTTAPSPATSKRKKSRKRR